MDIMENQTPSVNVYVGVENAVGIECGKCGEINPEGAGVCEQCSTKLKEEKNPENEFAFGEEMPEKIPLEDSKYLNLLKDTLDQLEDEEITLEEYYANVSEVLTVAQMGKELFETDIIRKKVMELPDDQQALIIKTAELFDDYFNGCVRMLEYDGGEDEAPIIEGFEMIEDALTEMDQIQDEAMELASKLEQEYQEEVAEEKKSGKKSKKKSGKSKKKRASEKPAEINIEDTWSG
jgi:hypothetical protein